MSLFSGLKDAKSSERGAYLNPGLYEVQVKKALMKATRSAGDAFILEVLVTKSNRETAKAAAIKAFGDRPYDLAALEKTLPNEEGKSATWFQSLKDRDVGLGAIKGFCASITGFDAEHPDFKDGLEAFMEAAVDLKKNSLAGMIIPLEVVTIQTKKGTDFGLHKWGRAISGPTQAATAAA